VSRIVRRFIVLGVVLLVFLAAVLFIAFRRQAPVIPLDEVHAPLQGRYDTCMSCHGPDQAQPRGPNHPFGLDCYRCHYWQGERG